MDAYQTSLYLAIIFAVCVIAIVFLYFIIIIIRQQRQTVLLYKEKIAAEITSTENERKRIAADLHDDLGPLLSGIKFKMSSVDAATEEETQLLEQCGSDIDGIISRMRSISQNLMPTTLINKGIAAAVDEYIQTTSIAHPLQIIFTHALPQELQQEKTINLFRIIQEIIHNTIKHAAATRLLIELKLVNKTIVLLTQDNGKGYDYKKADMQKTGMGLYNLQSRTEMMGGEMYAESKLGKGTKYTFEIPLF